jgi:hypothetical protein
VEVQDERAEKLLARLRAVLRAEDIASDTAYNRAYKAGIRFDRSNHARTLRNGGEPDKLDPFQPQSASWERPMSVYREASRILWGFSCVWGWQVLESLGK